MAVGGAYHRIAVPLCPVVVIPEDLKAVLLIIYLAALERIPACQVIRHAAYRKQIKKLVFPFQKPQILFLFLFSRISPLAASYLFRRVWKKTSHSVRFPFPRTTYAFFAQAAMNRSE